jgi:hypothetical protein
MMFINGLPTREIDGLPYSVHQISDDTWQIVIQNCARHPAGYTFQPAYHSYEEAIRALENWPGNRNQDTSVAGDDTGSALFAYDED